MTNRKSEKPKVDETSRPVVEIKATVSTSAFARAIKIAEEGMHADGGGYRGSIPVLACGVISAGANGISVEYCGTDTYACGMAEGKGSGAVAIPLRPLAAFVGSVSSESIEIIKPAEDARVRLVADGRSLSVVPFSPGDAPRFSTPADDTSHTAFSLAEGVLGSLLGLTLPFVSREETRYYLNGVALGITDRRLTAVATDGHRLGKRETTIAASVSDLKLSIVPRMASELLNKVVGKLEVDVAISANRIEVRSGDIVIRSKLIDGTFPDYRRVIPAEGRHDITFKASEADKVLKAARSMAGPFGRGRAVRIFGEGKAAQFTTKLPDDDLTFEAVIEAIVEGKPNPLGLNASYLAAIVKALGGGDIRINIDDANNGGDCVSGPMRITSTNSVPGDLCVLMPMRI